MHYLFAHSGREDLQRDMFFRGWQTGLDKRGSSKMPIKSAITCINMY